MLEILFFSYFSTIFFLSAGILFSTRIVGLNIDAKTNFFKIGLYGVIFLSFIALFVNFFSGLNKNLNTIILVFFLICIFFLKKETQKKIFVISIPVALICCLLITFENTYRPDAGLYHLPYINILNNEKIIIGLSNIHFRFGHTSIIQYVSAINNNLIFNEMGILIPAAAIFSLFILYLIQEIKDENNKIFILFNLLIIAFLCLKLNRYSDFGNDAPAHIFYFFLTSIALKNYQYFNKENMGELIVVASYLVFSKITLFLGSLIPMVILLFKKKINYFSSKVLIFVFLFSLSFFLKNFLVSGCLAFPIEKTCVSQASWYDSGSKRSSNAKMTMMENEAWTKAWSDQKINIKDLKTYLSDFGWIKIWSQSHGKRIVTKLSPFLFFLIIISISIHFLSNAKKNKNLDLAISSKKGVFFSFLLINIIGSILWFFKFPVFRYGSSYLVLVLTFFAILINWNKVRLIDLKKLKKIFTYFILFLLIVFISKNTLRIVKNYGQTYNGSPWPKIYSETKNNKKKIHTPIFKDQKLIFFHSTTGECYYNDSPCTHVFNTQFTIADINLDTKFGYKIFYFKKINN